MKEKKIPITHTDYKVDMKQEQEISFLKKIATQIESSIWVANKESLSHGYRDKFRTLHYNLKNPDNQELRLAIINGSITPENLATMSSKDLVSHELKRKRLERENQYLKENVMLEAPTGRIVAYSHKVHTII
jgi:hypothetical protein